MSCAFGDEQRSSSEKPIHLLSHGPSTPPPPPLTAACCYSFGTTAALSPVAVAPAFFRCARRSTGSGEVATEIFAGWDGGSYAYPASTPAQVVLLLQFSIAMHFLPVEALHDAPATPESDLWPSAVQPTSHYSLLPRLLVDVGLPSAVVDMRRSCQPAWRRMRWRFAGHNESVLELLSAVRRSKLSTFLISFSRQCHQARRG